MFMSDNWQPAVLQILPFTANDASNVHPTNPHFRSKPSTDHGRGFPVLAVTRQDTNAADNCSKEGQISLVTAHPLIRHNRASSERLTRAQTYLSLNASRAKSSYGNHHSGLPTSSLTSPHHSDSQDAFSCATADTNERTMPRLYHVESGGMSKSRSGNHESFNSFSPHGGSGELDGNGSAGVPCLPKPAFNVCTVSASADDCAANGNDFHAGTESRYLSTKNGFWRSMTLTPGEKELKKHRDQMQKAQLLRGGSGAGIAKGTGAGHKNGHRHKMNIRDLPRSTTPINDHDPDKLNMKQVIAFLQTKGKSQADAMELPKENGLTGKKQSLKSGALKGCVQRSAPDFSTAMETAMRTSSEISAVLFVDNPSSAPFPSCKSESSKSTPLNSHSQTIRGHTHRTPTAQREFSAQHRKGDSTENRSESRHKKPKRPFRLHRFLTMVPVPNDSLVALDCPVVTNSTSKSSHIRKPDTESTFQEPHLMDQCVSGNSFAPQLKSPSDSHRNTPEMKMYRVSAHRPGSLRVENADTEVEHIPSSEFIPRANDVILDHIQDAKNIIRLPHVQVDSDDEESVTKDVKPEVKQQAQEYHTLAKVRQEINDQSECTKISFEYLNTFQSPRQVPDSRLYSGNSVSSSDLPKLVRLTSDKKSVSQLDIRSDIAHVPDTSLDQSFVKPNSLRYSKQLRVKVPTDATPHEDNIEHKTPSRNGTVDLVTLSLRKERNRTREKTYMSEIGGS